MDTRLRGHPNRPPPIVQLSDGHYRASVNGAGVEYSNLDK
jgi:hypothetical protein